MATFPKLIDAATQCDGRERKTVEWYGRMLRDGGLIPNNGKRGHGAPPMDFEGAANLLIGLNVTDVAAEAAAKVEIYRALVARNPHQPSRKKGDVFARLGSAETFGEALALAIEGAPDLMFALWRYIDEAYGDRSDKARTLLKRGLLRGDHAGVFLVLHRPMPFAEIKIATAQRDGWRVEKHFEFRVDADEDAIRKAFPAVQCDRRIETTIGIQTLLTLYATVADDAGSNGRTKPDLTAMIEEELAR